MHPLARQSSCKQTKGPYEEQGLPQMTLDTSDVKKLTDLAQLMNSEQLPNQHSLVANLNAAQQRQMLNVQELINQMSQSTNLKNNMGLIKNGAPNVTPATRPMNMVQGQSPMELPKQSSGVVNRRSQRSLMQQQNQSLNGSGDGQQQQNLP